MSGFQVPSFDLSGNVAAVTGGNRGIGRSIALGLAAAGASVAILSRNEQRNAAVVAEIEQLGQRAHAVLLDVTDRPALKPAIDEVEARLGRIDILVNNAGTADISGGILNQTEEGWDAAIAVHLTSTMLLSKFAAASMKARGRGKIINLSGGGATGDSDDEAGGRRRSGGCDERLFGHANSFLLSSVKSCRA